MDGTSWYASIKRQGFLFSFCNAIQSAAPESFVFAISGNVFGRHFVDDSSVTGEGHFVSRCDDHVLSTLHALLPPESRPRAQS